MYRAQHESAAQPKLSFKPNPVEPDSALRRAVSQQKVFQYAPANQIQRVLHSDVVSQLVAVDADAVKRRKLDDGKAYDLPRLPVRATQERRPRLPPTLSGLYQPPPDAGLLPSISIEKPEHPVIAPVSAPAPTRQADVVVTVEEPAKRTSTRSKTGRNRWSDEETRDLIQGASRFGIGNWTKILQCPDYKFRDRTALDLKDKFRVLYPEQYGGAPATERPDRRKSAPKVKTKDTADLGARTHFPRSTRRQRHGFSEAEDEHLLQGFRKYGKSWSSIQQDPVLMLSHRTRTDLRDRMRNKFPDLVAKSTAEEAGPSQAAATQQPATAGTMHTPPRPLKQPPVVSPPGNSSNWRFDPDMSFIFDDVDYDQAVTLDRGILDWPVHPSSSIAPPGEGQAAAAAQATALTSLPSLATVRANDSNIDDLLIHELPALAQFLTQPLELDARSSAHAFLSLDELLS